MYPLFCILLLLTHVLAQDSGDAVRVSSAEELIEAVASLQNGQTIFVDAERLELPESLTITARNVQLRGGVDGATIVCPESTTALFISSRDARIVDLRFAECRVEPAVVVEGRDQQDVNVLLRRVTIQDNILPSANLSVAQGQPSSFISPLLIRRCRVEPCRTALSVEIDSCSFLENAADQGGAVYASDAQVSIVDSEFVDNEARLNGGAVFVTGPRATIEMDGCRFSGNRVIQGGRNDEVIGTADGLPLEIVTFWTFPFPTSTGGALDVRAASLVSVQNTEFESNLAPAGGAVAFTVDITVIQEDEVPESYLAEFTDCTFDGNEANYTDETLSGAVDVDFNLGGALYIVSNSPDFDFRLESCTLERNSARFGGALHMVTNAGTQPSIIDSQFSQNSALESGGAILLRNTGMGEFGETNCTDNIAGLGGCMMLTNNAQIGVTGLAGIGEHREGIPSFFVNNSAINGGAIICASCRNVNLEEPTFIDNVALSSGGAIYILEASHMFSIEQATFRNNIAQTGGAIAIDASGNVRISTGIGVVSRFIGNMAVSGAAIHATANSHRQNRLEVVDSVFRRNEAVTVEALLASQFSDAYDRISNHQQFDFPLDSLDAELSSASHSCGIGGGGAFCLDLDAVPEGAVADYLITDTIIEDNRAVVGGGIFAAVLEEGAWNADENLRGRCPDTQLYDPCRALRFVNVSITQNFASAAAGGIFIHQPDTLALHCDLLSDPVTLRRAMRGRNGELDDEAVCTRIVGNTVAEGGFGDNVGGSVNRLIISNLSGSLRNHTSGMRILPECDGCPENRTQGVLIEVIDHFSQVITDGIPDAQLGVNIISDHILGERRYAAVHGVINVNNTRGIGIGVSNAIVEIEAIQDPSLGTEFEFSTRECFPGEEQGDIECAVCPPLQYAFNPTQFGCRPCEDGANCTGGAALVPVAGHWHSTPFSPQFHECIIKEACDYADRVETLSAYYADRNRLDQEIRLLNLSLELGTVTEFQGYNQCAKGYAGILCGTCAPGFGHFAGGECVECPTGQFGCIMLSILVAIWMAFFVGVNIATTISSTQRQIRLAVYRIQTANTQELEMQTRGASPDSGSHVQHPCDDAEETAGGMDVRVAAMIKLTEMLKILVNYLQVTSVALTINLNWMGVIEELLSVEMMLVGVTSGTHFVPLDCTFEDRSNDNGTPNSIQVLWLRVTFPLMLLSFFILWCSFYTWRRRRRLVSQSRHNISSVNHFITFKAYCIVIVIVVVFFSYINITAELMRTVNCIKLDDEETGHPYDLYATEAGNRVWAEDTSLRCFEGDHVTTGVFGILGLIFFSFAVILFILTWLPANASRLGDPAFIAQYGFIYQAYKEKWYVTSWEAVITIRKALISAAVVYAFPLGPNLQGVCALGVLILALALHLIFAPFKTYRGHLNVPPYAGQTLRALKMAPLADAWVRLNNKVSLNMLESGSLLMSIIVFYAGILFNDDNTSTAGKLTMATFTFTVNLAFVAYVLYRLYYGAHVAVNQYCDHLKQHQSTRDLVPVGNSAMALLRKAVMVFRYRKVFLDEPDDSKNANRFEERL